MKMSKSTVYITNSCAWSDATICLVAFLYRKFQFQSVLLYEWLDKIVDAFTFKFKTYSYIYFGKVENLIKFLTF